MPLNGELIREINSACGNGWRKVFNVYAKWQYPLAKQLGWTMPYDSWQSYRDNLLLTGHDNTALYFTPPPTTSTGLSLIMGRTYAKSLGYAEQADWLTPDFGVIKQQRTIITPYFDYRQLTNEKIAFLITLIVRDKSFWFGDDAR